jgi:tRNA 2-thiouridine synthesizing protein A
LHTRLSGASGARHSLRPLNGEGRNQEQNSGARRGEIAKLRLRCQSATGAPVDDPNLLLHVRTMTTTKLDLTGLKCPLPALKTRKALKALKPGDWLQVHCTDPLSVIDIPNLIRETGDRVEISERTERQIVFLIEKMDGLSPAAAVSGFRNRES